MRLMRRLTNKKRILKLTLQSLPAVSVAIAFVIYGLTFLPLSPSEMRTSAALVEYVSYYEISADGKPQAWFGTMGDSLSPYDISTVEGRKAVDRRMITGVWVNRYDFFPSCKGRILIPTPYFSGGKSLSATGRSASDVLKKAVADTEKLISQLDEKTSKLRYYLSVHNVNDDGYNTMAAYSAAADSTRKAAEQLLSSLNNIAAKRNLSLRHVEKYTLLYSDAQGKTVRQACNCLTTGTDSRFRIIQTADRKTPHGATALYFHRWIAPHFIPETKVIVAANHGVWLSDFKADSLQNNLFPGVMTTNFSHDVPEIFAPNGSPVFTAGGRLMGISIGGTVCPAKSFNTGFNDLLP